VMRVCGPSFAEFVLFMVAAADAKRETDVNLLSTHKPDVFAHYMLERQTRSKNLKMSYYKTSIMHRFS